MNRHSRLRWSHAAGRVRATITSAHARAFLTLGVVLGLGAVGTMAAWTDNAQATSGTFTTGTVSLLINNANPYSFTGLTLANMLPGESRAATLQVQNKGTVPLKYTMAATTPAGSPALTGYLQVTIFPGAAPTNTTTNGMRTGGCAGTQVGQATLTAGGSVDVITALRDLAATSGADDLCVITKLSATAPTTVQNQTLSAVTFNFSATTV
ncbi:SipW-dependent-type signal peptide-containing protein [Rhodococcus sp. H36-A4]|uniref:SipW-dependent-type signal peptide-containing protein n=1 Tax=Rhodococcus sp. H36-A4 TaxID=3004353 RepID=UPI0022AECBBC|nr:SipW-dependent-type signal peptide-containing protein [Rhodococcus sp. H36-A4]MCZ4080477.1 SipW-dependent-type signal peptide-containing protein [Rhodococcus sp. H36-A4]